MGGIKHSAWGCMEVKWGTGGGRRRRGLHCTGMMNGGVGCITSESVRMHEVEVLCETIARYV